MKNTINNAILNAVASTSIKKKNLVFEVTGISHTGEEGFLTYNNGTLDRLPELIQHFNSLKSGSLWLTSAGKKRILGKRKLVCRKGDKYISKR